MAFDTLFENRDSLRNLSILDRVKDRAEAFDTANLLERQPARLDEYLGSVREMETVSTPCERVWRKPRTRRRGRIGLSSPWNGRPTECLRISATVLVKELDLT